MWCRTGRRIRLVKLRSAEILAEGSAWPFRMANGVIDQGSWMERISPPEALRRWMVYVAASKAVQPS